MSTFNLIALLLLVFITIVLSLRIQKWWLGVKTNRIFKKGRGAEEKARKVLKKQGFKIIQEQYPLEHDFYIDDKAISIDLRVDYLVQKKHRKFLVEVKSGQSAPTIFNKDTRRQLLEYHVVNPFDGLLLLDMESKTIKEVKFSSNQEKNNHSGYLELP